MGSNKRTLCLSIILKYYQLLKILFLSCLRTVTSEKNVLEIDDQNFLAENAHFNNRPRFVRLTNNIKEKKPCAPEDVDYVSIGVYLGYVDRISAFARKPNNT